jgi:NAD(P)-dependent dehydrogenase (short-subunit alcohol dehydrogenase family)
MRILATGNPDYQGLCYGIREVLSSYDVTYVSRSYGNDLTNVESIAKIAKDYDVLINSTNIPDDGQLRLLDLVYNHWTKGHIINVSTTSVYWNNQQNLAYYEQKLRLEQRSKELSNQSAEFGNSIRVSCIAYGRLDTPTQRERNDNRNKMSVVTAANYIKMLIESPSDININYLCLDPRQTNS